MNNSKRNQLFTAVTFDQPQIIEELCKEGIDPNITLEDGRTPLLIAAALGHYRCVAVLIAYGADVNYKCNGWTAIDLAAHRQSDHEMNSIIERSAKLPYGYMDRATGNPLGKSYSVFKDYGKVIHILRLSGAKQDPTLRHMGGITVRANTSTGCLLSIFLLVTLCFSIFFISF